ncbi:hypothetical protein LMH87_001382 [Akanthomyces muscarius]|uniref:Uncharacterized protein n=1 Tax=Akanthomyces muscarius TaxID=2231603 RepID=A0A9W8Q6B7_AKAMU|nr:hypothetical protein LMH87_001382 [Akanthomyces muscarius]KAJ4146823.1 hypothetical protein LMH87_001382 [Akanthomyces muscarius]
MISGHSVVLTYILSRTAYRVSEAPVPLPILDVTIHSWYRIVASAVEMSLPKMRSIGGGGITLGYSCTGEYSFPLIKISPSAGEGLQGFLTGGDLLVYHILARLARDVRTRIILDEPGTIQPFAEYAQSVRCPPIVIPDSQGESQDIDISDDERETRDAADNPPSPPDLPGSICWLNYSPWSPTGSWREMLLSVGPGRGKKGLEGRPCRTVIVATLTPGHKERDFATPAAAGAASQSQKRKRLLEDDSPRSQEEFTLRPGDEGYVDLTCAQDSSNQPRTCPGCHGCSQCTDDSPSQCSIASS